MTVGNQFLIYESKIREKLFILHFILDDVSVKKYV